MFFFNFLDKNSEKVVQVKHDVNEIFGEKTKLGSFDADATYKGIHIAYIFIDNLVIIWI